MTNIFEKIENLDLKERNLLSGTHGDSLLHHLKNFLHTISVYFELQSIFIEKETLIYLQTLLSENPKTIVIVDDVDKINPELIDIFIDFLVENPQFNIIAVTKNLNAVDDRIKNHFKIIE